MLPEFPPMRRSTPIGIVGAAGGLGAVTGPVVGSLVIDLTSWRGVFWINVPFCLLVLVIGPRFLSESRDPDATGRIDWQGVALGTAGIGSIMFAITQSDTWGFGDLRIGGLGRHHDQLHPRTARSPARVDDLETDLGIARNCSNL